MTTAAAAVGGAIGGALWWWLMRVAQQRSGAALTTVAIASFAFGALGGSGIPSALFAAVLGFGLSAVAPMAAVLFPLPDPSTPHDAARFVRRVVKRTVLATLTSTTCAATGYLTIVVGHTVLLKL